MAYRNSNRWFHQMICFMLIGAIAGGCRSTSNDIVFDRPTGFKPIGTQIEYPDSCVEPASAVEDLPEPHTLRSADLAEFDYWQMSLDEVVQIALSNSQVIRNLGGRVLSPNLSGRGSISTGSSTVFDVASAQMGEEAALSAFDAQFATSLSFVKNENTANRGPFQINGINLIPDRTTVNRDGLFQAEITKTTGVGTTLGVRKITTYNDNSALSNQLFFNTYNTLLEAEVRHPLLRGGGVAVNQIAGPFAGPGNYNGILIARMNTDIALAGFETQVRNFISEIYTTYWDLYFAYRNLDAQRDGLEAAREAWRTAKVKLEAGAGDGLDEALSQQQFWDFQGRTQNALSGSGAVAGIFTTERNLRRLMGVPVNDGRLIRPSEEPTRAEAIFDWQQTLFNGINRRVELRSQRWNLKRAETQMIAARNQLWVQLDLIGRYRWSGFGDDLLGNRGVENGSAVRDLYTGDLQSWEMGFAMNTPIGRRAAHAELRRVELSIARERAILRDQEQEVHKQISDSFNELSRAYTLTRTRMNQINAADRRVKLTKDRYEAGDTRFEFVLQAESILSDAQSAFFASLVEYNKAIADVHYASGTFLDYLGVELTEGAWSQSSHASAMKEARRFKQRDMNYCVKLPCAVSKGAFPQHVLPRAGESMNGEVILDGQIIPPPPQPIIEQQLNFEPAPETAARPTQEISSPYAPEPEVTLTDPDA